MVASLKVDTGVCRANGTAEHCPKWTESRINLQAAESQTMFKTSGVIIRTEIVDVGKRRPQPAA
ncbi:hypothetical protein GCM10010208_36420 [Actinomadura livida]|nr:hypothetical protein GCM10010208_36420 [Actinomadura livida]